MTVLIGVLVVVVLVFALRSVTVTGAGTVSVLERLGRFRAVLQPGVSFRVPLLDRVVRRVSTAEMTLSIPSLPVATADDAWLAVHLTLCYSVVDARHAVYEVANFHQALEQVTTTALRSLLGGMDTDSALTARDEIQRTVRTTVAEACLRWGLSITYLDVPSIVKAERPVA